MEKRRAKELKPTEKSVILGNSLTIVTLTPKRSLSQNPCPKKCLTAMVALETKDRMKPLPCVELTMQTKRTYGSVIYMHLRHLPPPFVAKVYHYVWSGVYNGVILCKHLKTPKPNINSFSLLPIIKHLLSLLLLLHLVGWVLNWLHTLCMHITMQLQFLINYFLALIGIKVGKLCMILEYPK